jgi:hypothetical protein
MANNLIFEISLVILILSLVFIVYGSRKYSVNHWMKTPIHKKSFLFLESLFYALPLNFI